MAENATEDARPAAILAELAQRPDGVLEEVARRVGAPLAAVLDQLADGAARKALGARFAEIWADLAQWGPVTFIVHSEDGVFETKASLPPGEEGRGYFNLHGDSPLSGHIRAERCASIYFIDRLFFGRRSCSLAFINQKGEAMFKVFVGRDAQRELLSDQVIRFERLRAAETCSTGA
jgi:heme iron utilization protein